MGWRRVPAISISYELSEAMNIERQQGARVGCGFTHREEGQVRTEYYWIPGQGEKDDGVVIKTINLDDPSDTHSVVVTLVSLVRALDAIFDPWKDLPVQRPPD